MVPFKVNIFAMVVYVLESMAIITQSSFTVAVLCREWVHSKKLSPVEMILVSLSICHFCQQWASVVYNFCSFAKPNYIFWNLALLWEFTNILTFWLTSLLALFYCVKISSFTHQIFCWLRWRILKLVPWLILGTLILACVTVIPSAIINHNWMELLSVDYSPRNSTFSERFKFFFQSFSKPHKIIGLGIPFLIFLVSVILLVASLVQHWGQMQRYNISNRNSGMKAQATALRSLAIFFIFFTSYFLTVLISFLVPIFEKRAWFWVCEAVIYGIVCIHSTSLMLSNPTLKKVLKI
uniref:taste receptor type 2 member 16 n=1 Tax=Jaculus jaculus TaxID=51337 RepID=UPI001E1B0EF7|nr:taste receptor type 2 member 16 [Jaculus jaculus]